MVFFKKNYIQSFASYEFFSASPFLRVGPDREYGIRPMDELKRGKRRALWNVTNLTQLVSRPKKYSTSHIFRKLLIGSSHCYFFQIFKVVILVLSSGVRFNPHPVRSYPAFFLRGHFFGNFIKLIVILNLVGFIWKKYQLYISVRQIQLWKPKNIIYLLWKVMGSERIPSGLAPVSPTAGNTGRITDHIFFDNCGKKIPTCRGVKSLTSDFGLFFSAALYQTPHLGRGIASE